MISTVTTDVRQKPRVAAAALLARGVWVLIAVVSLGFFVATAWAYYRMLLTQPFLGSTVQPAVLDLESVGRGLARYGLSIQAYAAILVASQVAITVTSCVLGLVIIWQRPTERVAWIMSLILVFMGTLVPVQAYALAGLYPVLGFLGFATNQVGTIVSLALIWIFPNGRFVPGWSGWIFLITCIIGFLATLFPDAPIASQIVPIALVLVLSGLIGQVYRYTRVSGPVERQQTKLVIAALAAAPAVWVVTALLLPTLFPELTQTNENAAPYNLLRLTLGNLATWLLPLALGLSILRYRLWDIDILIRRTLIYSALTGILLLVYFGSVVGLQQLLRTLTGQSSDLAIVASTLLIAALSAPLRQWVQEIVDRRLYRRKYDTARVLAAFGATVRDEVDLARLKDELLIVVNETMQPAHASLWVKKSGRG